MPDESNDPAVLCPNCPMCGAPALFLSPALATTWCPNDDCNVLMWDPWVSARENLADMGVVREFIDGVEQPPTGP